jgi:hypothetical protein
MRCSSCSAAGADLWFCSRDHQQLVRLSVSSLYHIGADPSLPQVWFAHRRVCGIYPFRQPPLSLEERATAETLLREALSPSHKDPTHELLCTQLARLGGTTKVSLVRFSFFLARLGAHHFAHLPRKYSTLSATRHTTALSRSSAIPSLLKRSSSYRRKHQRCSLNENTPQEATAIRLPRPPSYVRSGTQQVSSVRHD